MDEKARIIQKAQQEAERIVERAKEQARLLEETMSEKRVTYQQYVRNLTRKGFSIDHEGDDWILFATDSELKELTDALKKNLKEQKKMAKSGYLSAVKWKVDKGGWTNFHKCNDCDNGVSFSILKYKMTEMGIIYIETTLESAKQNYLKWGLQKSLDYLMELKSSMESQMRILSQTPEITKDYIEIKSEEIKLRYYIDLRKQQAKEELRAKKAAEREEQKAQKEFERELRKAQADEEKARMALEKAELEAVKEAANAKRFAKLQEQIEKLKAALKEAEERGQRIMSMAQQTRRGWVYIISNIGSFGEGVYKIGLTRRLDPMERVYELGDASVPFPFDVHAFIFSEDAPALETALHQAFDKHKVNSVNWRKEYFKVSLDDIKKKVTELGYKVEWEDYAYAPQFRDSMLRR